MDTIHVINGTVIVQNSTTNDFTNILISIITAIILGIGLWLNWRQIKGTKEAVIEERKIRYVQLLNEFDKDLTERETKSSQIKTSDDAIGYAIDIVNALDRMAHLYYKGAISFETIDYFREIFPYGLTLQEWLIDIDNMTQDEALGSWADFNQWCGREGMVALERTELPTILLDINELTEEEETRKSLDGIKREIEDLKKELSQMKRKVRETK